MEKLHLIMTMVGVGLYLWAFVSSIYKYLRRDKNDHNFIFSVFPVFLLVFLIGRQLFSEVHISLILVGWIIIGVLVLLDTIKEYPKRDRAGKVKTFYMILFSIGYICLQVF